MVGVILIVDFVVNRRMPTHDETASPPPILTVIEVQPVECRFQARGHGVARPAETWQAIANVAGRVVERHPDLESGKLLPTDTLLLALDPSRYRLAIAATGAESASLAAERAQFNAEENNTRSLLELERERLTLGERELARIESLSADGVV